ncbi:18626_t:CDS:2, partial [Gigaspora margarita]
MLLLQTSERSVKVIVDKKKKIHGKIEELLRHQLQKKQTEMKRYYKEVWSRKEKQTYKVTRLFSEIADKLANIGVNEVKMQNGRKKVQTGWEIEDMTKQRAIQAKKMYLTLPHYHKKEIYKHDQGSLIKGVLQIIQIKNIELEIWFEDKVMITSQLEKIITDMEVQCWLTDMHLLTMDRAPVMKT